MTDPIPFLDELRAQLLGRTPKRKVRKRVAAATVIVAAALVVGIAVVATSGRPNATVVGTKPPPSGIDPSTTIPAEQHRSSEILNKNMVFVDADHGWWIPFPQDPYGILATKDGGRTWTRQGQPGAHSLDFVDLNHGWAIFGNPQNTTLVATTVDGGDHWTNLTAAPTDLVRIAFTSATDGYALGADGALSATRDGGQSWRPRPTPDPFSDVCFSNTATGWAQTNTSILGTADGGRTWRNVFALPAHQGLAALACAGHAVAIEVTYGQGGGTRQAGAFISSDDAVTWRNMDVGLDTITADQTVWGIRTPGPCCPGQIQIGRSIDAGKNWSWEDAEHTRLPDDAGIMGTAAVDANRAWLALILWSDDPHDTTRSLQIRATSDGGATWHSTWTIPSP